MQRESDGAAEHEPPGEIVQRRRPAALARRRRAWPAAITSMCSTSRCAGSTRCRAASCSTPRQPGTMSSRGSLSAMRRSRRRTGRRFASRSAGSSAGRWRSSEWSPSWIALRNHRAGRTDLLPARRGCLRRLWRRVPINAAAPGQDLGHLAVGLLLARANERRGHAGKNPLL